MGFFVAAITTLLIKGRWADTIMGLMGWGGRGGIRMISSMMVGDDDGNLGTEIVLEQFDRNWAFVCEEVFR